MNVRQLIVSSMALSVATTSVAGPLTIDAVQITLIDEVELAARESGPIVSLPIIEGQLVSEGELVAQIDDVEPKLQWKKAREEAQVARSLAENDVKVRFAKKSREVAEAELRRAKESVERFAKSVSETELDRLKLAAERTLLEVEQAEHDQQIARQNQKLKETEAEIAAAGVERRKMSSPINGVVVEINRHRGEWVQPGDMVARLIRIDRVRAEGFVSANRVAKDLLGALAELTVDLPGHPVTKFAGRISFVSPEVNPINGEVRVWAEFENRDLLLRPGLQAELIIADPTAN
jgi:macrolide-specific efflux system membrane fusion protein